MSRHLGQPDRRFPYLTLDHLFCLFSGFVLLRQLTTILDKPLDCDTIQPVLFKYIVSRSKMLLFTLLIVNIPMSSNVSTDAKQIRDDLSSFLFLLVEELHEIDVLIVASVMYFVGA